MLPLGVRRSGIALIVICFTAPLGWGQERTPPNLQRLVPDDVMAAAALPGSPQALGRALASLHVPAGLVFADSDKSVLPRPLDPTAPPGRHALSDALERFERANPQYRVDRSDDGLLIAPRSSDCVGRLERYVNVQTSGPLNAVLDRLAKAVDPSIPDLPPSLLEGGGSREKAEANPFVHHVTLAAKNVSLRSALMELSHQAPGVVWSVRESRSDGALQSCTIQLLTADRTLFTSYNVQ